ncbi:MAG: DNA alkylation repair protein [Mucinivorans sp.]
MNELINQIHADLAQLADERVRGSSQRFFKGPIKAYGVPSVRCAWIARGHLWKVKGLQKDEFLELCEQLWASGYLEACMIACQWTQSRQGEFRGQDLKTMERWVDRYVSNWATCDTFCNHTVGPLVATYPELVDELYRWAHSPNRWLKRAAAVSLITPVRRGEFLAEAFHMADILLIDEDDMVQKGYGWLLKVASNKYSEQVFEYVMAHRTTMPRTALRYAIEKMPKEVKKEAMKR